MASPQAPDPGEVEADEPEDEPEQDGDVDDSPMPPAGPAQPARRQEKGDWPPKPR